MTARTEALRYAIEAHRPKARTFLPFLVPALLLLVPVTKDAR